MNCQVLISGAGPTGVAAAILLAKLGWRDIVIVERRQEAEGLDRDRAFNYQLEGRGQKMLKRIGIDQAQLQSFGLANDHFTLTSYPASGAPRTITPPILVPDRKTPYWMTRTRLMDMLGAALQPWIDRGVVTLLHGHRLTGFEAHGQRYDAVVERSEHAALKLSPRLLLGCDGLGSAVRTGLAGLSPAIAERMTRIKHNSPSASLRYKVLNLPPSFALRDTAQSVNDHAMAYAFESVWREAGKRMALFALPVASAQDPRSINIILPKHHQFWALQGVEAISAWLRDGFPQLDVPATAGAEELAAFAAAAPGQFPEPQYTRHIYQPLGEGHPQMHCLLLGDAAHSFPPDLGMGVNSALEDVQQLELWLSETDLKAGLTRYAAAREPEHAALVRLVQRVHPYQYNQVPWRLKLWTGRFLLQLGLHRFSRGLIEMPGFMLSQLHRMPFTEMEQRFKAGNRAVAATALGLAVATAALLS